MAPILLLLDYLSDGHFHSGEDIAAELNVSRTTIWKQVKKLNALLPADILSVPGKGYKLSEPLVVLNKDKILSRMRAQIQPALEKIEILLDCPSTNQFLLEQMEASHTGNTLLLAELQTQGRGRRGRQWVSPFASNIYMSLSWGLSLSIAEMSGLSLVVAISVANALKKNALENIKLKWPNDIYVEKQKLSGVLLELRGESNNPCRAVIGIGVNVNMPVAAAKEIDQPWIDMRSIVGQSVDRNNLVASILDELIPNLALFEAKGFSAFIHHWKELDLLEGKAINIVGHASMKQGIARGVDEQGALLVEFENKVQPIYSGEVSIRLNN